MPMRLDPWMCVLALMALAAGRLDAATPRAWERAYTGDEATGGHVVALWAFDKDAELQDSSGRGHSLALRGKARIAPEGRFGSCLESYRALKDGKQGAMTANVSADLSPAGAFTLELWLQPKPAMAEAREAFLLDNKYYHYPKGLPQANAGYLLMLKRTGAAWRPTAYLGYGKDSEFYTARAVTLEPGRWYHIAFTYDGAGTGRFCLDGRDIGGATCEGRGPIAPARYALAISDRYGSTHVGCPAFIDQVRITTGVTIGGLSIDVGTADGRTAFRRMEEGIRLQVRLTNRTDAPLTGGTARVAFHGERQLTLPTLAPRASHVADVAFDASLRPGRYALTVAASARSGSRVFEAEKAASIVIVPRPLPHAMPVVMWGGGDFARLKEIGFTHHLVGTADYARVWEAGEPIGPARMTNAAAARETLNEHLAEGIGAVTRLDPGRHVDRMEAFRRVDRAGKPYAKANCCATFPKVKRFAYNVGASVANAYGTFPALQSALIHTEVRGHTAVSFHPHDRKAFRRHAGRDIPRQVVGKTCPHYRSIPGFPADRVVPDDFPLLVFYRWFWKVGDGWNPLHTEAHRGLKSTGRSDIWTFYDPAVRVPSIWGSGGDVDVISQWTYCYPDPLKVGQAADELFAMADGRPGQKVMKMTQAIWYRSQTAPEVPKDESRRAAWEKAIPDARFITIAPDHLREALWCMLARPVRGIMYHGWGSLVDSPHGSYRFTNPETAEVLGRLVRQVVRPLGPALLQVPDRPADVALLESFSAQMLASRGSWGWSGSWEADMHLILQWAQLQPRIVYDETILRDGLDRFRVLVLPHCDVLTEGVARRIARFQKRGGILVADEHLAPALAPDILVPTHQRTMKADEDKATLQARAAALRAELDPVYTRFGESDSPDVVVRFRRAGAADYLFAVNDKRTFGTYVGHHGRVMEKGLPNEATLTVRRPAGAVYDLVRHEPVPYTQADGAIEFKAEFGPCEGRLFLIADRAIAGLEVRAPKAARLRRRVSLRIAVTDDRGRPVDAVVPVQVEILDPKGRPAEFSGYYGAKAGRLAISLDLAPNDLPGTWTLRARDLATGRTHDRALAVAP